VGYEKREYNETKLKKRYEKAKKMKGNGEKLGLAEKYKTHFQGISRMLHNSGRQLSRGVETRLYSAK
jgi:hypothetical protein